jgi:hypothetical protein
MALGTAKDHAAAATAALGRATRAAHVASVMVNDGRCNLAAISIVTAQRRLAEAAREAKWAKASRTQKRIAHVASRIKRLGASIKRRCLKP